MANLNKPQEQLNSYSWNVKSGVRGDQAGKAGLQEQKKRLTGFTPVEGAHLNIMHAAGIDAD